MYRLLRVLLLTLLVGISSLSLARAQTPFVAVLKVKGAINPVVAGYIQRGIGTAEESRALAVVLELDTPGGLDSSMRDIIQSIVSARIPVIVYVSPPGARAASAGAFITMAAHIAAMAPNTAIGAAHPVAAGAQQIEGTVEEKVVNDAVAYLKSLASERNRNVEWAERAIRESVSATEKEALELRVVDVVAPDLPSLLAQIDGKSIKLLTGRVTLETRGVTTRPLEMSFIERFLFAISDPNVAFILLSLAMTGLFLELSNPGAILPGIVGGIMLLLALFALGMLPVNWAGLLLIFLAFIFFLAEILVATHGLLAVGGAISLTLGALILFSGGGPEFRISLQVLAAVVASVTGFFFFAVTAIVRAHRRRSVTGREGLVGHLAVARTELDPEGYVFLNGERWAAISQDGRVEPGETVRVTTINGFRLRVTKSK